MKIASFAVAATAFLLCAGCGGGGSYVSSSSGTTGPLSKPAGTTGGSQPSNPSGSSGSSSQPSSSGGGSVAGLQVFPPDNPWNRDVSGDPVDPNSAALIASIGLSTGLHPDFGTVWNGAPNGIPYVVVSGSQA